MPEVIGHDASVKKTVTCECSAILSYSPKEVQSKHGTDYGGGPDGHEYVICPSCGDKAIIRSW